MISDDVLKKATVELLKNAVTALPEDINTALKKAYETEEDAIPKMQLKNILDNIELAQTGSLPMCQDTGIHIFYVTFGKDMVISVEDAIRNGLKEATKIIPLRPNAVHPLSRHNPGDNTGLKMPYINYRFSDKDYIEIAVMPKGAGSENMSALAMLTPSQGLSGIKEFALNTIVKAGGKPCPPTIIGMGIGGSADISMKLAKEALLRPINQRNDDSQIAELENELYSAINTLGIGPMGLGGKTTVLGVNIEYAYCHTASLPIAINIQCWAARRAVARIHPDGLIEHISHPKEVSP
ncbi:MAG: fumarate hydratase [Methanomassiliicoccales archaeon]|nr:MAG: fumarate hydratase [Methanomassiliicoccales archaeon]